MEKDRGFHSISPSVSMSFLNIWRISTTCFIWLIHSLIIKMLFSIFSSFTPRAADSSFPGLAPPELLSGSSNMSTSNNSRCFLWIFSTVIKLPEEVGWHMLSIPEAGQRSRRMKKKAETRSHCFTVDGYESLRKKTIAWSFGEEVTVMAVMNTVKRKCNLNWGFTTLPDTVLFNFYLLWQICRNFWIFIPLAFSEGFWRNWMNCRWLVKTLLGTN